MYNSSPTYYIEEGVFLSVLIKRNKYGELRIVISKVVNMNFKNRLLFIIIDIKDNSELELFHTYYQKYRIKY
jgi:hypothetical protein